MCFKLISSKKVVKCNCQITITEQSTKISSFESQLVLIQKENQQFKEENQKQKSQLKDQEQQLREFQSKDKEIDSSLKDENEKLKTQVKHLEQQLQQPQSKENDANSQLQEENKKLISQTKTLEQQLTELQSNYKESQNKLKEDNENLKGQIKSLEQQLKDLHSQNTNQSNQKSQEENEALKSQIKNLEKQLAESQSKQNDNESKRKQENEHFQQQVKNLEQQLKDLQSKDQEIKQLQLKSQEENEALKSQTKNLEKQLAESQSNQNDIESKRKQENEHFQQQVKNLEQQLKDLHSQNTNQSNQKSQEENEALKSQTKNLEKQLAESQSNQNDNESKRKQENEHFQQQVKNLEQQLKDLQSKDQEIKQLQLKSQEENEALKSQIKNLEKQLAESQSNQNDIESKRKQENEHFQQQVKNLEQQLKDLQSKDQEIKQLQLKLQTTTEKYQTLIQTNQVLIEENEHQLTQINILNQQITQINIQIQQCNEIHLKAEQNDALLIQIDDLKKQLEIAVKDQNLRQALEDMQQKLSLAEEQANEAQQWQEEAEALKQKCQEMEQKSNEFDETVQKLLKEQENSRKLSYQLEEFKEKMTGQDKSQEPIAAKTSEESKVLDEIENVDIENFEQDLQRLKEKAIQENDLLKQISKYKGEKPMLYINIWKIFEVLMDKKYENDIKDLEAGIAPRTMTQFMLDYLIMTYGMKSLAQKTLAQLLLGLQQLYQEKHIYGNLFCRFLQVYNPNPIDAVLATFLVQARNEFQKLIQAYASQKKGAEKPKQPNKTWGWDMIDVTSVGGNAPMMDLFELIQKYFESDKELGQNIMMRLVPDEQYKAEFYLLVLIFKIKKTGKTPLEIYQLIDQNKDGKLQISDFIQGMKGSLDLKLNEEEIACIINELDTDKTGDVSQSEFAEKIAFLQQKYKNKDLWLCSKAQFLTAISDEYDAKRIRDFNQLKVVFQKFDEDGNGTLEFREFVKLCKSLDPNIQQSKLADMFNFALKITKNQDPDVMSPQAFAFTAQRYNLGGFGTGIFNASAVLSAVSREEEDASLEKGKVKISGKKPPQTRSRIAQKAK